LKHKIRNTEEKRKKTPQQNLFYALSRILAGIVAAVLIWYFTVKQGLISSWFVYIFAYAVAFALIGFLMILTGKSAVKLSRKWENLPRGSKFMMFIGLAIAVYFGILLFGSLIIPRIDFDFHHFFFRSDS